MPTSSLDVQLDHLDAQLKKMKESLLQGDASGLQAAVTLFQQLSLEFGRLVQSAGRGQLQLSGRMVRVRSLAAGMTALRDNLFRQQAYVERALSVVLPSAREKPTYTSGATAYGKPVRGSGIFSGYSA